jgi:hypothetical protein
MSLENREIRSSVFADIFGDDELDGKKNFLSLYNAIHGTNLKLEDTKIEHKKIPQAICKPYDNDISMLINGQLIVLVEHQSTPNENMPLRCLEYYVHLLYGIIPAKARYNESLVKIPTPEFYVFYNGKKKTENEYIMKLSDAFHKPQNEPMCELKVRFMSIIGDEGKNLPVVQKCDMLRQYCEFMDIVFRYQAELKETPTKDEQKTCYEKAIREAISKGILVDYLTRKSTAVINMFTDEYDYELDMQVKAEEAYEKGAQQKAVEAAIIAVKKFHATPEIAAQEMNAPLELVLEGLKQNVSVKSSLV